MARVLSAIIFLPVLFYAVWASSPVWFVAIASIGLIIGLYEYFALMRCSNRVLALISAFGILAAYYYNYHYAISAIITAYAIIELSIQLFRNRNNNDLSNVLATVALNVFGVIYVILLGGYIIAIRMIDSEVPQLGAKLITLFFILVFSGDTGAYYTGRAIGKHKLAPHISPGKTIEGAIGGFIACAFAAWVASLTFFPELKPQYGIPLAVIMCAMGIIGDLCESMIKRGAKAKDAGKIIPGHGGLLDRLDSMLFNAPLLFYFYFFVLR